MLLNAIKFNTINTFKSSKAHTRPISFLANEQKDKFFKSTSVLNSEFANGVSSVAQQQLSDEIKLIANDKNALSPLGYGMSGVVYQIKNVDGFGYNGVVAKFSHIDEKNEKTGERQRIGCDFEDEVSILKKVTSLGQNSQQYVGKVKLSDGRNVLITTYVDGKRPDNITNPINPGALQDALQTLVKLDNSGVLHRDLKQENIVIDENDKVKLIDFGEAVEFDVLDFEKNDSQHNFAPFEVPTNLQSFEDTFISPYVDALKMLDEGFARRFYKDYLKQKANIVHATRADELMKLYVQNKDKMTSKQKKQLSQAIDYQLVSRDVLSSKYKDDNIVDIELMKNQVMYMSELAYKNEVLLANPLANISHKANALICAKKMEALVYRQLQRPNSLLTKRYLNYQLALAKYKQEKISGWMNGLVGWFCTCMCEDVNTSDLNKKKLIDECVDGKKLEDFIVPNIAQSYNEEN